jgi:hypothetical protein
MVMTVFHTEAEKQAVEIGVIIGRWYWVTTDGTDWFPAVYDEYLGWSNSDCWDDMYKEVTAWKLIPLPEEL